MPTSATSTEGAIAMAALGTNANDLAVDILGVVGVDVTGATAAVRNLRSRHFGCAILSLAERFVVASWFCDARSMPLELDVGRELVVGAMGGDFSEYPDAQVGCGCEKARKQHSGRGAKGGKLP